MTVTSRGTAGERETAAFSNAASAPAAAALLVWLLLFCKPCEACIYGLQWFSPGAAGCSTLGCKWLQSL